MIPVFKDGGFVFGYLLIIEYKWRALYWRIQSFNSRLPELINLQYFKCNHDKYDIIVKWYNRIDVVPEVKNIMKEWGPISKESSDIFY